LSLYELFVKTGSLAVFQKQSLCHRIYSVILRLFIKVNGFVLPYGYALESIVLLNGSMAYVREWCGRFAVRAILECSDIF